MIATDQEPVRHRPHVFRAPDLWTMEGDNLVRTHPSGMRDVFPLDSLSDIHLWRNTPTPRYRGIKFDSYLWANLCLGTKWHRFSGAYPRGIHGIENQDVRIKKLLLNLISRRQDDPSLRIQIGSRMEASVGRAQAVIVLVLPIMLLSIITSLIPRNEHVVSSLSLWGVAVVISGIASGIAWLILRKGIKRRINNGQIRILTAKEFLAEKWDGLDG